MTAEERTLPSVLIVDDDPGTVQLLTVALRKIGCELASADTGEQACKVLEQREFDVLVVDRLLPGMDGHEVIDAARALYPNLAVLMLTGQGTLESSQRGFRQKIDYYLTKPLDDLDDFLDTVRAAHQTHARIKKFEASMKDLESLISNVKGGR